MLKTENHRVRVEIEAEILADLFAQGVLCAADLRCLDRFSKQQVRQLCLQSCAKNLCPRSQVPLGNAVLTALRSVR